MRKINSIIKEEINNFLLNESLTDIVYHFTSMGVLSEIINTDAFYLSPSYGSFSDNLNKKKKFYLSLTRQKNGKLGYSRPYPVRITLDGNLLNYRFKGKAINYWGSSMGKNNYFANPENNGSKKIDYYQSRTENEDRLFSNEPVIYNFHKYIKRIDVLVNRDNENEMKYGQMFTFSQFRKLIHIYDNENDFNNQSKDEINGIFEFDNTRISKMSMSNRSRDNILDIIYFMSVIDDVPYTDLKKYCATNLKQYGLEKYIDYIVNGISGKDHYRIGDLSIKDEIKRLHQESGDMEDYAKTSRMVRDFFQKYGFDNENDAKEYAKKYYTEKYNRLHGRKNFDYDKKINLLALFLNGDKLLLPFPDKTPFFDVFPFSKGVLLDEVPYYVNSHKSKDDESFKKYLMHLVKSNVSITNMLQIIKKLDINDDLKESLLNYGEFKYVDLMYDDVLWGHFRYINNKEKDYVEDLFVKND